MQILARKTFRQFHKDLRWSTRVYVLLALTLGIGAFLLGLWGTFRGIAMILAIALVLLAESAALSFQHHARTWRMVTWALLLILAALMLTGWAY